MRNEFINLHLTTIAMITHSLVGHTSSNKPIYQYDTVKIDTVENLVSHFSPEDHFDAFAVFSYLQLVYWRRYGDESRDYISCQVMLKIFEQNLPKEFLSEKKATLAIVTAIDLSNYGRKHCVPYLQELLDT